MRVQPVVSGKTTDPGFVRISELTSWDAQKANDALALARAVGPGESGAEEQMERQLAVFERVAAKFPADAAGREAHLEAARLELARARRKSSSGQAPEQWTTHLNSAASHLEAIGSQGSLADASSTLKKEIDTLRASATPPSGAEPAIPETPPVTPPPETAASYLRRAERYSQTGRYNDAERAVGRALRLEPSNADAIRLRDLIKKQQEAEALLGR